MTAAAWPSARCRRLICTGAAATRLLVNTPAAVTGAPSAVATIARSGAPDSLIPDARPPAANPGTARDHGMSPIVDRAVVSGRPSMRLAFCSAWPDAPFTRLSSAPIASTVLVRAS